MIKLIKEETITEKVTTQIIYREAEIDLKLISSNAENFGNGLFKNKPRPNMKQVFYNKYKNIEGGLNEYTVRILTKGWVFQNDWYIKYEGSGGYYDEFRNNLIQFKQDNGPFILSKIVGINKEGNDTIPFITNEQVSEIVNIMNSLDKDEKTPTLAVPMRLITINGELASETIVANEDGSFPFLTMIDYAIAKELSEPKEE